MLLNATKHFAKIVILRQSAKFFFKTSLLIKKICRFEKSVYFCKLKSELESMQISLQLLVSVTINGEMPEWSIGAVSKTVDQLAGPRVRIPVSPPKGKGEIKSYI